MKELFISLLESVKREGISQLIDYLETTDLYIAPASSNYHGNYEKGLIEHSLEVYYHAISLNNIYNNTIPDESLILICLLHDICKVNFYVKSYRNQKKVDENNQEIFNSKGLPIWERVEYYKIEDDYPLGHGEKSVIILQKFIQLTSLEIFCIRWHMMSYDDIVKGYAGNLALTNALNKFPQISIIHCADLLSISFKLKSQIDESDNSSGNIG